MASSISCSLHVLKILAVAPIAGATARINNNKYTNGWYFAIPSSRSIASPIWWIIAYVQFQATGVTCAQFVHYIVPVDPPMNKCWGSLYGAWLHGYKHTLGWRHNRKIVSGQWNRLKKETICLYNRETINKNRYYHWKYCQFHFFVTVISFKSAVRSSVQESIHIPISIIFNL